MQHSMLTCSITIPSIIKIFLIVMEVAPETKMKEENGSGDIISKRR